MKLRILILSLFLPLVATAADPWRDALSSVAGYRLPAQDSDNIAFTPGNLAHWTGGVDPGTLVQGANQLASRLSTAETTLLTFANVLADLISLDGRIDAVVGNMRRVEVTVSAEGAGAANSFDVTVVIKDFEGNNLGASVQFMASVYTTILLEAQSTDNDFPITDAGVGLVLDSSTNVSLVVASTESDGGVQTSVLRIQDSSGALVGSRFLLLTPVNHLANNPAWTAPIRVILTWT